MRSLVSSNPTGGDEHQSSSCLAIRAKKCLETNETQDSTFGNQWPPSPDLSPRIAERRRFGGRGEQRVGTLTQGGARGDRGPKLLPSLALGYCPMPLQGSEDEEAASLPLHFLKNVQSPVPLFQGNRSFEKASPRLLLQGVGVNKDPLLVSPLCASQGGESISPPRSKSGLPVKA